MSELRRKLEQLIDDQITLFDFERWYVPYSWDNDREPLTGPVSLLLAEYSYGHRTYDDLKTEFAKL